MRFHGIGFVVLTRLVLENEDLDTAVNPIPKKMTAKDSGRALQHSQYSHPSNSSKGLEKLPAHSAARREHDSKHNEKAKVEVVEIDVDDDELSFASSEQSGNSSDESDSNDISQIKPKRFCGCCGEESIQVLGDAVSSSSSDTIATSDDVFLTCSACDVTVHKSCVDRTTGDFQESVKVKIEGESSPLEAWHCPKCLSLKGGVKTEWYEETGFSPYRCSFCKALHPHTYMTRMSQSGFWGHGCCIFAENTEIHMAVCCLCKRSDGAVVSCFL